MASKYGAVLMLVLVFVTERAHAYDFTISSQTALSGYQTRGYGPNGRILLNRRRFTQSLGVTIYNIIQPQWADRFAARGQDVAEPQIYLHALMRFDSELGNFGRDADRYLESRQDRFDLLSATLEATKLWRVLDVTLGRQYDTALLDFVGFDGASIRLALPAGFYTRVQGGVMLHRNHALAVTEIDLDGTASLSDADGQWRPFFTTAIGIDDPDYFGAELAYRRVGTWDQVQQEVVVGAIQYRFRPWQTNASVALRQNLLVNLIDDWQVMLAQPLGKHLGTVQLEFVRSRPHFDGASIFNVFVLSAYEDVAMRYVWTGEQSWIDSRVALRSFDDDARALSASVSAGWARAKWLHQAELFVSYGYGGTQLGADGSTRWQLLRWLSLDGRFSVAYLQEKESRQKQTWLVALQTGISMKLVERAQLNLAIEDNLNRDTYSAIRVLALLDMEFAP